jgi:hypothetical protein
LILVFSDSLDDRAENFVQLYLEGYGLVFSHLDLWSCNWKLDTNDFFESTISVNNKVLRVGEISGVITLTPAVYAHYLLNIVESDREYIANEINAFLFYFFSQLNCKMLNRPVIGNLLGSNWRYEMWLYNARACGFSTEPYRRRSLVPVFALPIRQYLQNLTIVGDTVIGTDNDQLIQMSMNLKKMTELTYLRIFYYLHDGHFFFHSANVCPAIEEAEIANLIVKFFNSNRL